MTLQLNDTTAPDPSDPTLTEQVAQIVAGIGQIGEAAHLLEKSGFHTRITGQRVTVNREVDAYFVGTNGRSWWNVYSIDGKPPVYVVGTTVAEYNWSGAE